MGMRRTVRRWLRELLAPGVRQLPAHLRRDIGLLEGIACDDDDYLSPLSILYRKFF